MFKRVQKDSLQRGAGTEEPGGAAAAAAGAGEMQPGEATALVECSTDLGKRRVREGRWDGDDFEWTPSAGVRCYMNGTPADAERRRKILRTSLLFMQLQKQVSEAVRWRHARDAREAKLSAEIAAKHPVRLPCDEPGNAERADATETADAASECPAVPVAVAVAVVSFEDKMKAAYPGLS